MDTIGCGKSAQSIDNWVRYRQGQETRQTTVPAVTSTDKIITWIIICVAFGAKIVIRWL